MNGRAIHREPASSKQNSLYLVHLLLVSVALVVSLPHIFPAAGILFRKFTEKEQATENKNSESWHEPEGNHDISLEVLIVDLQKVIRSERERIRNLEKDIRILQISRGLLRERMHYLEEEKSRDSRRRESDGSGYNAPSLDLLLQNVHHVSEPKKASAPESIVQDLTKTVVSEKKKTSNFEMEMRALHKSFEMLEERVRILESRLAAASAASTPADTYSNIKHSSSKTLLF